MPTFTLTQQERGHYFIKGGLTFHTIKKQHLQSFEFLQSTNEICIDLLKVDSVDSAGLALIIEWIKFSQQYNTKLIFKNVPQQLLIISQLSGFEYNQYFLV